MQEQLLFTENVFTRLPMGVEIYDADGVLRRINDYAMKMYGVDDRAAVIGSVNLFKSPYCDEELQKKIRAGEEITLEFEYDFERINSDAYFASHNRNSMIYEVRIVPVRNKDNAIIAHILLANDVTATKEADYRTEESKKNLEMAMDAANMSSWVYDVHKKVFATLYGDTIVKDSMTLEALQQQLHPQDRDQLTQLFTRLVGKEIEQGHFTVRFYSEQEKQYRYYESRIRLSTEHRGKLLIVGTQVDVTERIQMSRKTQELIAKRELAMQVSNIVHWDFDVLTGKFESYNDPINDFASDKLLTVQEFLEVIHPDDRSVFNDTLQSMLSGKDQRIDCTCRLKTRHDATWQYCNVIGVPFERDDEGNIIRFTGFRQNISKMHQLDEELKERNYKMELTFKTVGMSYWDFDVQTGRFRAFNDPVNDYHSEQPIAPEEYLNVTHPDDTRRVREYLDCMLAGEDREFNFEYRSRTKWDQEWQTLVVTGVQVDRDKRGKVICYTGIKFNNTNWEKMACELKELKEKAELSDRLKSAFLANMSHEIRTPLNAIVGFSELMVNCDDQAEKEEYMNIIQSNNELLLRLINDILDLSKIESGILERKPEKFDLAKVCTELYTMIQPKITNPEVEFRLDNSRPDCWVFLDRNRLKQVWMNFLTNAVKCTSSGYVKMGYSVETDGIRIYVEDTGAGIPTELQDRVFGRFQKLNEFAQGTGLGLAISRAIVEAAGGKVGFASQPGVGSTFWAWLPCEIEMRDGLASFDGLAKRERPTLSGIDGKELRILIAEDNDSNYLLVQHILKNYNLVRVQTGVDAVNRARDEHFDLVLMDMKMPVMDGLEATRKIREFNADIPIVALTANAFDSDRVSALDAGCNAFLAKPLKKSQLLDIFSMKW